LKKTDRIIAVKRRPNQNRIESIQLSQSPVTASTMAPTVQSLVWIFYASFFIAVTILNNDENIVDVEAFVAPSRYLNNKSSPRNSRKNSNRSSRIFLGGGGTEKTETAINKQLQQQQPLVTMTSNDDVVNPSSTRTNVTLSFPPFYSLMDVRPGEFIASEPFVCCAPADECNDSNGGCSARHQFRVKLYPRGGGDNTRKSRPEEVVGLYLQYLGSEGSSSKDETNDSVDTTFSLRLKGRQRQQRFDVEWRAGMRFVSDAKDSNLNQGDAKDFGFPLMQTNLLKDFVGIVDTNEGMYDPTPIVVEAEVLIHNTALEESLLQSSSVQNTDTTIKLELSPATGNNDSSRSPLNKDIRLREDGKIYAHDTERVRVGKIVVPVLSRLSQRPKMFERGTYPGVEYRILRILKDDQERFTSCPGAQYELKPVYPLVGQLERQWPVRVKEEDIPRLYTPSMYNILSVFGSLFLAASGLFTSFLLSQAISLFFIPSKSMDPTLKVGDVLLVDKLSSRSFLRQSSRNKVGDIVLFSPPSELQQIVARNGGKLSSRDLFVKRIAASTGDKVTIYKDGNVEVNDENVVDGRRDLCEAEPLRLIEKYIQPSQDRIIDPKEVFVMGDCSSVSVDSRVWGPLETKQIVGRPILRLWPLERFGKVE
jgi:signal peptidase I